MHPCRIRAASNRSREPRSSSPCPSPHSPVSPFNTPPPDFRTDLRSIPAPASFPGRSPGGPGNYATTLNATPSVGALVAVSFNWKVSAPNTPETGGILREWWNNVPGDTIADLTANPSYPANPSGHDLLPTLNIARSNYGHPRRSARTVGSPQPLLLDHLRRPCRLLQQHRRHRWKRRGHRQRPISRAVVE